MSRVTHRDIAARLGVDRSTVSRVLNNKAAQDGISSDLAAQIAKVARELDYVPNTAARAVRMGRFNCAALLMSTDVDTSYLPGRLLNGIHDELAAADYHLTVSKLADAQLASEDYVPKILRTLMCDGLLINYTHHLPMHLADLVIERGLPAVWINRRQPHDAVFSRSVEAGRQVTERLLALGHRRIAYVDMCHGADERIEEAHYSVTDRYAGYAAAMKAAGLKPIQFRPATGCRSHEEERAFAREVLSSPERPTALVCYFAIFAPAVLHATRDLNIRVPDELSITCFGPDDFRSQGLTVSSMLEPHYDMGRTAVRLFHQKLRRPKEPCQSCGVDFVWQDLGTCGPVPVG